MFLRYTHTLLHYFHSTFLPIYDTGSVPFPYISKMSIASTAKRLESVSFPYLCSYLNLVVLLVYVIVIGKSK